MTTDATIKDEVRKRYAKAAVRSQEKSKEAADGGCCGGDDGNKISSHLYTTDEIRDLPQEAVVASLGCGNPSRSPRSRPGRRSSTSARAAASTCCSRRAGSAPRARPTASI